jgi:GMP synthase PP-ATPase subunit
LGRLATRIIDGGSGISRVTCDISAKPPGTIGRE